VHTTNQIIKCNHNVLAACALNVTEVGNSIPIATLPPEFHMAMSPALVLPGQPHPLMSRAARTARICA